MQVPTDGWVDKENVVNAINIAAGKLSPEAMAIDLDSAIFQITAEESPIAAAMKNLKKEIQTLYWSIGSTWRRIF